MKKNCWELRKCGREEEGARIKEMGVCLAAIDAANDGKNGGKSAGRYCWAVAGTFCGGVVQGTFAQKKMSCLSCDVFQAIKEEEGASFVL